VFGTLCGETINILQRYVLNIVSVSSYKHGEGTTLVKFYLAATYINIFTTCIKHLLHYYYYWLLLLLFRYIGLENSEIRN
jgi:hypothetical protein